MDSTRDMWLGVCTALLDIIEGQDDCVQRAYRFMQTLPELEVKEKLFPFYSQTECSLERLALGSELYDTPGQENREELHTHFGFLQAACRTGDIRVVLMLLCWGVDPRSKNRDGLTALQVATIHGHMGIITRVLALHEELLEDTSQLRLVLCGACRTGRQEFVDFWLEQLRRNLGRRNCTLSPHTFEGSLNPLVCACQGHHYSIAADLIKRRIVVVDEGVVEMIGPDIAPLLKTWVETDEDSCSSNNNNNKKELIANWHHKQLHTFDPAWLQDFRDSRHQVLCTINLSQNTLVAVPEGLLWGLPHLRRLNLSQNSIKSLPAPKSQRNLSECQLKSLSLFHNCLESVPVEIFMLESLEFLSVSHNSISQLVESCPESAKDEVPRFWRCTSLSHIDMSQNRLSCLPRGMVACTALTNINLSDNKFTDIPQPWACPLEILNMSKNRVHSAHGDMPKYWHRSLRFLNLSYNRLTEIPPSVCQMSSLTELDVSHNVLRCFPSPRTWSIGKLQHLNLSYNQLVHRHPELQRAQSQEPPKSPKRKKKESPPVSPVSEQTNNFKARIRGQLGKSPMKIIDANSKSTFYADSPTEGGAYSSPEKWEKIEFPECFVHSLYVLKLSHNALASIPPSICRLEGLYDLDVSCNPDLHTLPHNLSTLKHLFHLKIDGLDVTSPAEVGQMTPEERTKSGQVLRVLRENLLDSQPFHSMKLMVMGPAKSGKTTVLSSLMNDRSGRVFDTGMHMMDWVLQDPLLEEKSLSLRERLKKNLLKDRDLVEGPNITFFSWDMKGGDLYENVHQCFITPRTLYLLVWDMSEGMEGARKLSSLLLNISSRSSDFGIVIVGTHSDLLQNSPTEVISLRGQLANMLADGPGFPPVPRFVEVDARGHKSAGMPELRRIIYETALQMTIRHKRPVSLEKLIGRKVPRPYMNLRSRIAKEAELRRKEEPPRLPIMTDTELAQIVQLIPNSFLDTAEDLQEAISFLHEIGSIVHFTDHLHGLNDLYFIDPVWLACTLQRVTTLPPSKLKGGKVHVETLRELSVSSRIGEDKFEQYLQLLARFEIVVPISHHWFLVPARLPRDNPGVMLSEQSSDDAPFSYLRRIYQMPYLPPGFWIRLVSRLIADLQMHDKKARVSPSRIDRRLRRSKRYSYRPDATRLGNHDDETVSKSVTRGVKFQQTESIYWREGVFFRHKTGQILVRPAVFSPSDQSPGVDILVSCQEGHFAAMGCVVDQIEGLIKDWYPGLYDSVIDGRLVKVHRLVPCPVCVVQGSDELEPMTESLPHCYTVEELVQRIVSGETHIAACSNSEDKLIPIDKLIPDMFMKDLTLRHLKEEDFDLQMTPAQSLGQGGFGEVFRAKFRGTLVAAKTMLPSKLLNNRTFSSVSEGYGSCQSTGSTQSSKASDSVAVGGRDNLRIDLEATMLMESFQKLRNEVTIMVKLDHPCIVNLVGVSVQHLCFAMDFAPMGDVQSYLLSRYIGAHPHFVRSQVVMEPLLGRTLTYKIAQQVSAAVQFLHSKDIIYCDLKTDNILLFSADEEVEVNIKLTDYGISRTYDLMGAMGMAGPPGFCAPEILQGKIFDEKVDWFSYGMFLYHLLTGLTPYHDKHSRLEIQLTVNEGRKPSFDFQEYRMPPLQAFPALGALLQSCWQDRPGDRPHGKTILHLMSEPSFLCLRRVVEVDEGGVSGAFSRGMLDKDKALHMMVDTGMGASVRSFHADRDISYRASCQMDVPAIIIKSALITPCGSKMVVGTVADFVQIYQLPWSQSSQTILLVEARVSSQPTSLLYVDEPAGHTHPLIFVAQASGTVTVFSHETKDGTHGEDDFLRSKVRLQSNKSSMPCTNLVRVSRRRGGNRVVERWKRFEQVNKSIARGSRLGSEVFHQDCFEGSSNKTILENGGGDKNGVRGGTLRDGMEGTEEVWVGRGSNISIISLEDLSQEPDVIKVAGGVDGAIEQLVHTLDSVWCFTSQSQFVYQYNVDTRKCLSILDCHEGAPKAASQLLLPPEDMQEMMVSWKEKEKAQELANTTAAYGHNSNRDCRQPSLDMTILEEDLPMVDDHFVVPVPPQRRSRLQRARARLTLPRLASSASYRSNIKVTCLLAVENVLWIGRSSGDIVLVNLSDKGGFVESKLGLSFGSAITTLTPKPLVQADCGKVLELHLVGPDRVVACHSGNRPSDPPYNIKALHVWENWDTKRMGHFQSICFKQSVKQPKLNDQLSG